MFKNTDKRWIWLGLGGTMVLLRYILGHYPELIEQFYSRGFYIGIRWILDYTIAFLPIPSLYVFILTLLSWGGYRLIRKRKPELKWWQRILQFLFSTIAFLSGVVFFFLLLWGFNYGRVPLEDQIGIKPKPLDRREVLEELSFFTPRLMENRRMVRADTLALNEQDLPDDLHQEIRKVVEANLLEMGYPDAGQPRLRQLRPQGVLLRISTAGFYMPLTGECQVDAGLHPIQLPFVMAHEYYHAYGFTDEGSCNFMAFLACIRSDKPFIRYAGYMGYWRYLAGGYRRADRKLYGPYYRALPASLRQDLKAIRDRMDEFPDILPEVRNLAYNTYLKAQGIQEGIKNYSRIVMLAAAWRKTEEGKKRLE